MHEWTSTKSKVITDKVPLAGKMADRAAQDAASNSALENIEVAISECEKRVKTYKDETERTLRICAKLNSYVSQNALMASSDADEIKRMLENRIAAFESLSADEGSSDLKQMLSQYNGYLGEEMSYRYTASDVQELIQELYTLPMNGSDLKEAMEVEETARRKFTEAKREANPVIHLAGFCGRFISKFK